MRFVQGLENSRFSSMQTHFANELNLGRDLYPVDLNSAAAQASRWMIAGSKGPQDVHTSFAALRTSEQKSKEKKHPKKPTSQPGKHAADTKKCIFCNNLGHTVLECNKLKQAQAAAAGLQPSPTSAVAKSPSATTKPFMPRKATTMLPHFRQEDADDEDTEESHFMMSHICQTIDDIVIP